MSSAAGPNDRHDNRRRDDRHHHRPPSFQEQQRNRRHSKKRERSPDPEKERLEEARRARMARLRAENEQEEAKLAQLEDAQTNDEKRAQPKKDFVLVDQEELEGLDEEEQMQRLLGFSGGFSTTKEKEVEDNSKSAARGAAAKNKARKYRQYMNRKGGFNRPLDKMA